MQKFFDPAGIVAFGVSAAKGNLGQKIVANLKRWGYEGRVLPVGRREGKVEGIPILTSTDEDAAFEGCDLAVILTPAHTVPGIFRRCADLGIRHIIVESAGFEEFNTNGRKLQEELVNIARAHHIRFVGPNCVGVLQLSTGNIASFSPIPDGLPVGDTAIIAQSGGVGVSIQRTLASQQYGIGWMVSVGNKLDVDEVDLTEFLLTEKPVGRLVCYLESMSRGRPWCDAVRKSDVPVVVHKVNRTSAAARVAQSHTAALANDDAVVTAALEQAGAIRAQDTDEVILAVHATRLPEPKGPRVALLSRSGGHAVIAADACALEGLELPPFSSSLVADIEAIHPVSVIRRQNPLDFGDLFDFNKMVQVVERAVAEEEIDGIVLIVLYNQVSERRDGRKFLASIADLSSRAQKPIAVAAVVEETELIKLRGAVDWPIFATPEAAVHALGLMHRRHRARERARGAVVEPRLQVAAAPGGNPARVWSLARSLELVESAGIPVARSVPHDAEELPSFPVVAKYSADTDEVIHKAAAGLVRTSLSDAGSLTRAVTELEAEAERRELPAGQVLVQSHLRGAEVFLGAKRDASFGPMVLFGCGGRLLDVVGDTVLWPYPFTLEELEHRLGATRLAHLVGKSLPATKLAAWLAGLGELLVHMPQISEIDVNPVMVDARGGQAIDARVVMA